MTKDEIAEVEQFRQAAFSLLSAEQQYRVAFLIAENIGYTLLIRAGLARHNGVPIQLKHSRS
jgi:hypothetical protein